MLKIHTRIPCVRPQSLIDGKPCVRCKGFGEIFINRYADGFDHLIYCPDCKPEVTCLFGHREIGNITAELWGLPYGNYTAIQVSRIPAGQTTLIMQNLKGGVSQPPFLDEMQDFLPKYLQTFGPMYAFVDTKPPLMLAEVAQAI